MDNVLAILHSKYGMDSDIKLWCSECHRHPEIERARLTKVRPSLLEYQPDAQPVDKVYFVCPDCNACGNSFIYVRNVSPVAQRVTPASDLNFIPRIWDNQAIRTIAREVDIHLVDTATGLMMAQEYPANPVEIINATGTSTFNMSRIFEMMNNGTAT